MGIFLFQFLFKFRKWVLVAILAAVLAGLFSWGLTQVTRQFVPAFVNLIADRLKLHISFQSLHYSFPRQIILKQLVIKSHDQKMLELPRVVIDFAFPLLGSQERIRPVQMRLDSMSLHMTVFKEYLSGNGSLLWKELSALPRSDIKISLNNTKLYLFENKKIVAPMILDMDLALEKGRFISKIKNKHSFLQLWGHWLKDGWDWKGYMFYSNPAAKQSVNVLDINGRLSIDQEKINLDQLSFVVNGDEFSISGYCMRAEPMYFETNLSYLKKAKANAAINLYGHLGKKGVEINAKAYMDIGSLKHLGLGLESLKLRVINDNLWQLKVSRLQGEWEEQGRVRKFILENFLASLKPNLNEEWMAALSVDLYGGQFQGHALVGTKSQPWKISAHSQLDGLNMNRLGDLEEYFKKTQGQVSGHLDMQSVKPLSVRGKVFLKNGHLPDFSFLRWDISKVLQMPSLRSISGADLSLRFKMDGKMMDVEDFKLSSEHVNANGYFRLASNQLVSSKIYLLLSQQSLSESPIGKKVIGLVPKAWNMPIELRLSGNLNQMNFQWDDSLLKNKIQNRLPHFVENIIERTVNDQIAI